MRKYLILGLFVLLAVLQGNAQSKKYSQTTPKAKKETNTDKLAADSLFKADTLITATADFRKLNGNEWNRVLNSAFGRLVGSAGNPTTIGNYASFEPVNGSFTFKGTAALGNKDSLNMSYLGISASGDLISNSYAALFSNTKLNSNAGITLEYNFRFGHNKFETWTSQESLYHFDLWAARDSITKAKNAFKDEMNLITEKLKLVKLQIEMAIKEISRQKDMITAAQKMVDDCKLDEATTFDENKAVLDILVKRNTELPPLQKNLIKLNYKVDSMQNAYTLKSDLITFYKIKQDSLLEKKKDKFLEKFELAGMSFSYLTVVLGGGNNSYYTFSKDLPFNTQLTKKDYGTYRLGLVWNQYIQNSSKKTAWFFNLAAVWERTNNTALLSTTEISQEVTIKNTGGDTVRKVTKKYNAYTEQIDNYRQWSIYGNAYYLFGSRTNGLHVFPSYYMPDQKKGYMNAGLGYLVSFINTKKDQPVINFEGYIQFNDVFNSTQLPAKFFDRNEIGIRFTVPFTSLLK